ncbi:MAG: lytic transglycosylase domain-containing protein [Gammaproteobacteria bacterium]
MINLAPYEIFILSSAKKYSVPSEIIKAIIIQESSGRPGAYREEKKIKDASRGLMQILLGTARQLGFSGPPDDLFSPEINIDLGTKYLAYQFSRYQNWDDAFAAYNSGSVIRRKDGARINQPYVDAVRAKLRALVSGAYGYIGAQATRGVDGILNTGKIPSIENLSALKSFLPIIFLFAIAILILK